jgi:hypothetical protein
MDKTPAAPLDDHALTRLRGGLGVFVTVVCGVVTASAVVGAGASVLTSPPTWFLLGFELVTIIAGVVGVLLGLGRFAAGPGLGLLCVAGAIGVNGLLGYLGAGKELMGVGLKPFLAARLVAAGVLVAVAGVAVLGRRPMVSLPRLAAGLGCAAGVVAVCLGAWKAWSVLISLKSVPLQALIGLIGFALVLGLLAAAVHLTVRAFQACDVDQLRGAGAAGPAAGNAD